jgi:hypothetical protein
MKLNWRRTGADWRAPIARSSAFCASAPVAPVPIRTGQLERRKRRGRRRLPTLHNLELGEAVILSQSYRKLMDGRLDASTSDF